MVSSKARTAAAVAPASTLARVAAALRVSSAGVKAAGCVGMCLRFMRWLLLSSRFGRREYAAGKGFFYFIVS